MPESGSTCIPPWILHSKHFSVDDEVAVIGSSNMDMRSFALNYEVVDDAGRWRLVARIREVEDGYRALSRELTSTSGGSVPWSRFVDNPMRLTAALSSGQPWRP